MAGAVRLRDEFFRGGGDAFEFPNYSFIGRDQWDIKGLGRTHIINHEEKRGTKNQPREGLSSSASWFRIFILKDSTSPKRPFLVKAKLGCFAQLGGDFGGRTGLFISGFEVFDCGLVGVLEGDEPFGF